MKSKLLSPRRPDRWQNHYSDVIMSLITSQINRASIVYSNVCWGVDQRKYQSTAPLAFVRRIHRCPLNYPQKGPVTRKCFHFMTSSWLFMSCDWETSLAGRTNSTKTISCVVFGEERLRSVIELLKRNDVKRIINYLYQRLWTFSCDCKLLSLSTR